MLVGKGVTHDQARSGRDTRLFQFMRAELVLASGGRRESGTRHSPRGPGSPRPPKRARPSPAPAQVVTTAQEVQRPSTAVHASSTCTVVQPPTTSGAAVAVDVQRRLGRASNHNRGARKTSDAPARPPATPSTRPTGLWAPPGCEPGGLRFILDGPVPRSAFNAMTRRTASPKRRRYAATLTVRAHSASTGTPTAETQVMTC